VTLFGALSACGEIQQQHEHEFGEWETVKESTCYEKGGKNRACASCGEIETKELPLTETHDVDEKQICKLCGRLIYKEFTVTSENLDDIGYTGQAEFAIPDVFQDENGIYYQVTAIDEHAFIEIQELTSVIIPDTITAIGNYAFSSCENLVSVTIPDKVIRIGRSIFNKTKMYNTPENWEDGVLYVGKHLIDTKFDISGKYTVKEGTLTIAGDSFNGRWGITEVTIPGSVKYIGEYAFTECREIEKVNFSSGLECVGGGAFLNCFKITEIILPDTVTDIESCAFYGCKELTNIYISDGVTAINDRTFAICFKLEKLTLPSSIEEIGPRILDYDYTHFIPTIEFRGTKAQWDKLKKDTRWDIDLDGYTIICKDGTIVKE
jgi:hypothetical protein